MEQSINFDQIHSLLMERLHRGERPHLELDQTTLNEIKSRWQTSLDTNNSEQISEVMCILDHARHPSAIFDDLFFLTLERETPKNQLVFTLGASWKHLLGRWSRAGDRVPMRYIEILKKLLKHDDIEVREWVLRTIDQIGPQGRLLQKEINQAKVGWRGLFNPHAKSVSQLIAMLEKRWSPHDRSK